MTDVSSRDRPDLPPEIARDLEAFRGTTARDVPELMRSVSSIRHRRPRVGAPWKEQWMNTTQAVSRRPWLAMAALVGLVVAAVLVVPISYERVVGHEVALSLAGAQSGQVAAIAKKFKAALGSPAVRVRAENLGGASSYTLETRVPSRPGVDAPAVARAFAKGLTQRGFSASVNAMPVKERRSGNVYAYARDIVIQVSTDGKSAAEIEAEIERQLAEAGIPNAQVTVTDEGENRRKVMVEAHRSPDGADTGSEPGGLKLELTKDGQPISNAGCSVAVKKLKGPTGTAMVIEVNDRGRETQLEIPNVDGMSDAQISAAIESQLRAAGFDLKVTVSDGRIDVERP
ncbi:MAG TPA: hypothetical protein VGK93_00675 [Candidatus Eisenbacteria bacterium]|jgi:hypothetical protein